MKLLLVSVTLNCFCVSADVWDFIFGPRLKPYSSRLLENENNTEHNYVVSYRLSLFIKPIIKIPVI